jgi:hypothetical protein
VVQDAISQIMAAEEQALVLHRVASERAAEMRAEMTRQCEQHYEKVERAATAKREENLEGIRARMERLQAKKSAEAEEAAAALLATLREDKIAEAVRQVVWGIVEKCQ